MLKHSRRDFFKKSIFLGLFPLTAIAKKASTLRFIHITDSHMDLSDTDSIEAMELMVQSINKNYKNLDFVLFGGDNFNNNVKGNKDAITFKNIINKLHCPSYLVRGNKESNPKPNDNIHLEEFKKLFFTDSSLKIENKNWSIEKKGYLILGLDSCIEGHDNGSYTEQTLKFAEKHLKIGKPTVILNHHPYTNYWKEKDPKQIHKYVLNNTEEAQKRLFSYKNFILSLSGHKHIDWTGNIQKTKAIVTRGFIRPLDLDMYPMRYVEIKENNISEKIIYTS
jgi:Icc protein